MRDNLNSILSIKVHAFRTIRILSPDDTNFQRAERLGVVLFFNLEKNDGEDLMTVPIAEDFTNFRNLFLITSGQTNYRL